MLKTMMIAAAVALAPMPVLAQGQGGPTAAQFAQALQTEVGKEFDGGIRIVGIEAEGNTLIFKMSGPAGWREGETPESLSDALVGGFCKEAPDFFDRGLTMRVHSIDGPSEWRGPLVRSCPPPED
ncbi:MAG TPA: hypothetical protein PKD99_10260 [Sphingopyxis sp.]|nr:hypothetical protein [Sphingopyxis sp.]HMP45477.1 hypothetical protein [Sphingopyxis sp.]